MDSQELIQIIRKSASVKLLRLKNSNMVLDFLVKAFDNRTALSSEQLHNILASYINQNGDDSEKKDLEELHRSSDDKAKNYIKTWTDDRFLTNYRNEDGEIYYELSSDTSKVIDWINTLKKEEYIGTESKFKSIFTQLKDLVEFSSEDIEKRKEILLKKKLEIEEQLQNLELGEQDIYEDYQIVPRFRQINQMAKDLLSDFKDVDKNFQDIIKSIFQKQTDPNNSKGKILEFTFDALSELKNSSQGKSFYAFWEFLRSKDLKDQWEYLISELYQTLENREIEADTFLKNMIWFLLESGKRVSKTNDMMAEKLSHIIRTRENSTYDAVNQITQDIQSTLLELSKAGERPDIGLVLDDDKIEICLPIERVLKLNPKEVQEYSDMPQSFDDNILSSQNISKVLGQLYVDRKTLENNIIAMLKTKRQVTIGEIVSEYKLTKGLSELFGYISVANKFRNVKNEERQEYIVFDETTNKRITIPEIIITR